MARKKKEPLTIWDATRDITEKDIARQNYYRLLSEQSARNISRIIHTPQRGIVDKLLAAFR